MHSTPKQKSRIDQRTADLMGDMCGLDTILSSLRQMRPHAFPVSEETAIASQKHRNGGDNPWTHCTTIPGPLEKSGNAACATALKDFASITWPRVKKDVAWLDQATKSRQALSHFWELFKAIALKSLEDANLPEDAIGYSRRMLSLSTTPEYLAELERGSQTVQSKMAPLNQHISFPQAEVPGRFVKSEVL